MTFFIFNFIYSLLIYVPLMNLNKSINKLDAEEIACSGEMLPFVQTSRNNRSVILFELS